MQDVLTFSCKVREKHWFLFVNHFSQAPLPQSCATWITGASAS